MNMSARRFLFSGLSFWIVFVAIGLYFIIPLRQKLRFGIDLVGGTYITMEVQTDKAVESELAETMQSLPMKLKAGEQSVPTAKTIEKNDIVLTFDSPAAAQAAATFLQNDSRRGRYYTYATNNNILRMQLTAHHAEQIKRDAVRSNIEVLRTRLDTLSVAEITIAAQGEKNIIVELPDVSDPQQAKAMIGKAAKLEFKLVEKIGNAPEDILYELDGVLPRDKEILAGRDEGRGKRYYLVSKYTDITGGSLREANASLGGQTGAEAVVSFKFNADGSEKFYALTSKNIGKQLAVVLDGIVITAPTIRDGIRGEGSISGTRSTQESQELALLLKSGAFVAPVTFEEERQIGPSLGAESIRQGVFSCLVGLGLLFIFSLLYYKVAGLLAFFALLYNLLLILVGMAWLRATLTLPGIAGMVLTIGMAIDASILIYEQIKDELAAGVTVRKAVDAGFSNAMVVILDANITTFIVGAVLYYFGTGPIQGFAVTMMLGIVSTLITGLFFLKSLFSFVLEFFNVQKLKI
ncbi:MAG: protein translocase subunit SecD [Candidatus Dependentiae bacterium]|nr:protein translocase subunit SecD [Candidatus Dependentiae bacterium]